MGVQNYAFQSQLHTNSIFLFCALKEEGLKHIFHHVYKILTKNFVAIFKRKASVCAKIFLARFPKAIIGH